jgi:hypothetical protein
MPNSIRNLSALFFLLRGRWKIRPGLGGTPAEEDESACPANANTGLARVARMLASTVFIVIGSAVSAASSCTAAQDLTPFTGPCAELNHSVINQIATGHSKEAESALSAELARGTNGLDPACAGPILSNLAVLMQISGRFAEAEGFAGRAVNILDGVAGRNAPALLRPLQILAIVRLEQGKVGMARKAFQRMQLIPVEQPESRALVRGVAASLLDKEGKSAEAESEYREELAGMEKAGRGNGADAASARLAIVSLCIKQGRLDDAARMLDRALAILNAASDTVPWDRIKELYLRAVLYAREGKLQNAEEELKGAISLANQEKGLDPAFYSNLLANYANVLRKNHQRREARAIEARAAGLRGYRVAGGMVDVSELSVNSKAPKK